MRALQIDRSTFDECFAKRPFVFEHSLAEQQLLQADAIPALAASLPEDGIEHHIGKVDAVTLDGEAPRLELSPVEIARRIEELECWMMLRNVERVPPYDALLADVFGVLEELLGRREGAMVRREGYVFFSAAGSVTPTHLDSEHNFLCHVRGPKEVVIGGYEDARTAQLKAERKYRGGQRNLDCLPHEPVTYALQPGQGVYIPPLTPHFVRTGDELCSSMAVTFRTTRSMRNEDVHAVNGVLRRLGIEPSPPGRSDVRDAGKAVLLETWRRRPGRRRRMIRH